MCDVKKRTNRSFGFIRSPVTLFFKSETRIEMPEIRSGSGFQRDSYILLKTLVTHYSERSKKCDKREMAAGGRLQHFSSVLSHCHIFFQSLYNS